MKLIFNPYYDSKVYEKTNGCVVGEKVVGPQGLLSELELRAGLTGNYLSDFQRTIYYARAMKSAIASNSSLFFTKSFAKDKLGTAAVVLGWRDALVKAGWNKKVTGSLRLDDLASVEANFDVKGEADRWRSLLDFAGKSSLLNNTDEIEVTCKKENLEPLYRQLFDNIEANGGKVCYSPRAINTSIYQKASAYMFDNDIKIAEWLAQQPLGDNDVVVSDDTSILNIDLALDDKPQIGSESNAIGAIMQIFSLGISLFSRPLNLNTLLAYLQLPTTPLNSIYVKRKKKTDDSYYYQSLRWALFEQLLDDNGISSEWDNLIKGAMYDHDGNDLSSSKKQKDALLFINQWRLARKQGDDCEVDKSEVIKYVDAMRTWARKNLFDESTAMQFNAVSEYCDTMLLILEDEPDIVKTNDLTLWATQINRPVEISTLSARRGSINITHAVTDIHTDPDTLYWVCTQPKYNFRYDLDFLSPDEIGILRNNGIEVTDRETLLKVRRETMLGVLSNVKKNIFLLECKVIGGDVPVEDSVATELRLDGNLVVQPKSPDQQNMEEKDVDASSSKQSEYQVDSSIFSKLDTLEQNGGIRRDSESYSSLDELIQRPFDYVMDYILGLREYGRDAMSDIDTVKGNVAHAYVEMLTEKGNRDVDQMQNIHNTQFDDNINILAETMGAILLLEENDLEFKRFKSLLEKSINILLKIIKENSLTLVGAEQYYEAEIPEIGNMNARIDYVLTDSDGNYVIIDFKWNEGKTYERKLVENDALQLAVYRAVLEKYLKKSNKTSKVSFMGYFVLPRHTLYTVYDTLKSSGDGIELLFAENNNDLMAMATNSYVYRMEQLKSGLIEEGESLELANLQYVKDAIDQKLYPLRSEYNNEELKGNSYGNKNIVLKGGLV